MSIYREHIEPVESVEKYLARIASEKREAWNEMRTSPLATEKPTIPIGAIPGLAMAPMNVVMA